MINNLFSKQNFAVDDDEGVLDARIQNFENFDFRKLGIIQNMFSKQNGKQSIVNNLDWH